MAFWRMGWMAAVLVAAAGMAACDPAVAADTGWPTRREGDFLIVETPHYVFRTDHDPETAQLVASQQETLFQELYRRMGRTRPAGEIKRMDIVFVRTEEKYRQVMGASSEGSQGLYTGDRIGAWGSKDQIDSLLETLRHEGTHQFVMQFIGGTCPVWLSEGLAVFFQNARFVRGRLEIGQVPLFRLGVLKKALKENRLIPLSRMLGMPGGDWAAAVRGSAPDKALQYQQAWAMVHFLEQGEGGKYRAPFLQYLHYLSRGGSAMEAWEQAFGTPTGAFEVRWKEYVQGLKPTAGLDCRTKISLLGNMAVRAGARADFVKDIGTLHKAALAGALGGWKVTLGDIEHLIDDPEGIEDLFHCPDDTRGRRAISYELVPGKPGETPVVRCTHHIGYVLETEYEPSAGDGGMRVKVVARPSSPAGMRDAKGSRRFAAAGKAAHSGDNRP